MGWKAMHVTGSLWPCNSWRAGARGSHDAGSELRFERDVGVAESSSDWREELRVSSSII